MEGDSLHDSSLGNCCDTAANNFGEIEILGEGYCDVTESIGLLQPVISPVSQAKLVDVITTLAERTGQ